MFDIEVNALIVPAFFLSNLNFDPRNGDTTENQICNLCSILTYKFDLKKIRKFIYAAFISQNLFALAVSVVTSFLI